MNIVFLSPYFPKNYYHFCQRLKNMGVNVLGIGDQSFGTLRQEVISSLTEYYKVDDMHNYDSIVKACNYFVHHYGKLDRFESLNEYWLELDARIRTDFNITGRKIDRMPELKQKSNMKSVFRKIGIPVADGILINNDNDIHNFIAKVGYPVVIKPDKGVGASDTYRLNNEDDLNHFLNINRNIDFIIEEFINGAVLSFDGLTNQDGEIVFYTSHIYSSGVMEMVNDNLDTYYYSSNKIPIDLVEMGKRIVKGFDLRERFFHIEFFRIKEDNKLIVLEINARPPGGLTLDMFNYANNIDMYQQWANIVVHNRFDAKYDYSYCCGFAGRKLNKNYIYTHNEIIKKYGEYIVLHCELSPLYHTAMGAYAYIVHTKELDKLLEIIDFIQNKRE